MRYMYLVVVVFSSSIVDDYDIVFNWFYGLGFGFLGF